MRGVHSILLSSVFALALTGQVLAQPATVAAPPVKPPVTVDVTPINDPIEPFNRAVFNFNCFIDHMILKPVTTVYKTVLPDFMEHSVTSFLANLGSPIKLLNEMLQGDWDGADVTFRRFLLNTTAGIGGLIDVAGKYGVPAAPSSDFGQTLGKWGVGHGFYLVLPIIGPSSARDGSGRLVDTFADPYNMIFWDSETEWPIYARAGLTIVDARARYGDNFEQLLNSAVDPYVTFRSIYSQQRAFLVQGKTAQAADAYAAAEDNM